MSADTLDRTDVDTDIEAAIEGAFDELDCCSVTGKQIAPCGGKVAGYQEFHETCTRGWLCEVHWKMAIEVFYPQYKEIVDRTGRIRCATCLSSFYDVRKYVRYTPV